MGICIEGESDVWTMEVAWKIWEIYA